MASGKPHVPSINSPSYAPFNGRMLVGVPAIAYFPSYDPVNGRMVGVPAGIESPRDFNLYGKIYYHIPSLVREEGSKVGIGIPGPSSTTIHVLPSECPVLKNPASLDEV